MSDNAISRCVCGCRVHEGDCPSCTCTLSEDDDGTIKGTSHESCLYTNDGWFRYEGRYTKCKGKD